MLLKVRQLNYSILSFIHWGKFCLSQVMLSRSDGQLKSHDSVSPINAPPRCVVQGVCQRPRMKLLHYSSLACYIYFVTTKKLVKCHNPFWPFRSCKNHLMVYQTERVLVNVLSVVEWFSIKHGKTSTLTSALIMVRICGEFTYKSGDAVQCSFTLSCVDKQTMRTVKKNGCGIQAFRESNWTKSIPPIGILPTWHLQRERVFLLLWSSRWLHLHSWGRGQFSTYW